MCFSREVGLNLCWLFDEENPLLPSDTFIDINYRKYKETAQSE